MAAPPRGFGTADCSASGPVCCWLPAASSGRVAGLADGADRQGGRSLTTDRAVTLAANALAAVLALTGVACLAVALTHQQHAPYVPLSVSASPAVTAAPVRPVAATPSADATSPPPAVVGPILPASAPVSLAIPAIGVQSRLVLLGVTGTGAVQVPAPGPDYDRAGWYRYSPEPGTLGPSVIAGHVDSARGGPSVFFRLGGLRPGDRALVTRADGSVATFAVDEVRRYHKAEFPTQVVYGDTDHAALRLISCGGAFDARSGHYLDNIVVLASLVS